MKKILVLVILGFGLITGVVTVMSPSYAVAGAEEAKKGP